MANMGIRFDISGMVKGLTSGQDRAVAAIRMYAETGAQKLQTEAKNNARWTDRTGRARQGLNSYVSAVANGYRIALAHGVNYGIWLELAHEKRFSIIPQTIEYVGTFEIMPGFQNLLNRLGGA